MQLGVKMAAWIDERFGAGAGVEEQAHRSSAHVPNRDAGKVKERIVRASIIGNGSNVMRRRMGEMKSADGIAVRRARPEDDAALGELLVAAYVTAYAEKMPQVVVTEERKRDLRAVAEKRNVALVLVAEEKQRVVGTVALWPQGAPGSEAWIAGACDLRHLATDPSMHGRGLSRLLMNEAERLAREELRAYAICLHVRRGNEGVRRLYESRGYVRDEKGDLEYPSVSLMAFVKTL